MVELHRGIAAAGRGSSLATAAESTWWRIGYQHSAPGHYHKLWVQAQLTHTHTGYAHNCDNQLGSTPTLSYTPQVQTPLAGN